MPHRLAPLLVLGLAIAPGCDRTTSSSDEGAKTRIEEAAKAESAEGGAETPKPSEAPTEANDTAPPDKGAEASPESPPTETPPTEAAPTTPEPVEVHGINLDASTTAEPFVMEVEVYLRGGRLTKPLVPVYLETVCIHDGVTKADLQPVRRYPVSFPGELIRYDLQPFGEPGLPSAPTQCQLRVLVAAEGGGLVEKHARCLTGPMFEPGPCPDWTPPPPPEEALVIAATQVRPAEHKHVWDFVLRRGNAPLPATELGATTICFASDREHHAARPHQSLHGMAPGDYRLVSFTPSGAGGQDELDLKRCDLYLMYKPPIRPRRPDFARYCFLEDVLLEGLCKEVDPPPAATFTGHCATLAAARGEQEGKSCEEKLQHYYPEATLEGVVQCMVDGEYIHGCFEKLKAPATAEARAACKRIDDTLKKDYELGRDEYGGYWFGVSRCAALMSTMTDRGRKEVEECMVGVCEEGSGCMQSIYECAEGLEP